MPFMCCVPGCRGNYKTGPKVSMFRFPKDESLRKKWLIAIRRKDFIVTNASKVCSLHFKESDFEREASAYDYKTGRTITCPLDVVRLKKGAVPLSPVSSSPISKSVKRRNLGREKKMRLGKLSFESLENKSTESCQFEVISNSILQSENEDEDNAKIKPAAEVVNDTTEENVTAEKCYSNDDKTSSTEVFTDENHNLSNNSCSSLVISEKVEESWEKEYIHSGDHSNNMSGDSNETEINKNQRKNVGNFNTPLLTKPQEIGEREVIFGKLVASEISDLCDNRKLYLKTKQSILNILIEAHFEKINSSIIL